MLSCLSPQLIPREDQKLEYERQLQQEVEALRARTALELDQLKTQTREMFERENRWVLGGPVSIPFLNLWVLASPHSGLPVHYRAQPPLEIGGDWILKDLHAATKLGSHALKTLS